MVRSCPPAIDQHRLADALVPHRFPFAGEVVGYASLTHPTQ